MCYNLVIDYLWIWSLRMSFNNKKYAYSLSEIMVVMLVLSIIFAAVAPFFTKRRIDASKSNAVWQLADTTSYDAHTEVIKPTDRGQMFFGLKPTSAQEIESIFSPLAKLVIRSGPVTSTNAVQRQIQFRYGYDNNNKYGAFAGTWLMDGKNTLLGGSYTRIKHDTDPAINNTAIGYRALTNLESAKGNTAIGYNTLQNITKTNYNTAIGSYAGSSNGPDSKNNTNIGAYAGHKQSGYSNTTIGYNAGYGEGAGATGYFNTLIGAGSGRNISTGSYNLALGYKALASITTGNDNIAVGYGALQHLTTGSYNVAIGYNACNDVTTGSKITCIGANSGPHTGDYKDDYPRDELGYLSTAEAYLDAAASNNTPRTYIGSKPTNFGGDAVLEIHNVPTSGSKTHGIAHYFQNTPSNVTTVINGNLIVRGRPYFTSGGTLYHVHDANYIDKSKPHARFLGYSKHDGDKVKCQTQMNDYNFTGSSCVKWPSATTSDRRLKNIGTKFTDGLDKLTQIKVYDYTFKNDPKKSPRVGVIAQQLQKIFPNAVTQGSDGYLRIRWDEIFYAAINAVKELDKKLVALVNKITNIDSEITKLEEENLVLQSQVDQLEKRVKQLKAQ